MLVFIMLMIGDELFTTDTISPQPLPTKLDTEQLEDKMVKSKKDERIWWMILADAENFSHQTYTRDPDECWHWHLVSTKARDMLRDTFKINLDTVGEDSRELLNQLYDQVVKEEAEEEKVRAEMDLALEQFKKTIKDE